MRRALVLRCRRGRCCVCSSAGAGLSPVPAAAIRRAACAALAEALHRRARGLAALFQVHHSLLRVLSAT